MVRFLGGNVGSRNIIKGEEILKAGLVVVVGIKSKEDIKVEVMALVLQTIGLTKEPLQITGWLILENHENLLVESMCCTCKAGLSERCKHIGAVLWYLNRHDLNDLEQLSSTDVKCLWANKKKMGCVVKYKATKIRDFCHVKQQVKQPEVSEELLEWAMKTLLDASPDSALALHRMGSVQTIDNRLNPDRE